MPNRANVAVIRRRRIWSEKYDIECETDSTKKRLFENSNSYLIPLCCRSVEVCWASSSPVYFTTVRKAHWFEAMDLPAAVPLPQDLDAKEQVLLDKLLAGEQ